MRGCLAASVARPTCNNRTEFILIKRVVVVNTGGLGLGWARDNMSYYKRSNHPVVTPSGGGIRERTPEKLLTTAEKQEEKKLEFSENIDRWFGSPQQFSDRVLRGWRLVVVDCLLYPYTVFCRQCQLLPYYQPSLSPLAPLSSVLVLHHIGQTQGVHAWWRGWQSHMVLQIAQPLLGLILERLWESADKNGSRLGAVVRYITLRSILSALTLPLVSCTYLEMVQNTTQRIYKGIMEAAFERPILIARNTQKLPFVLLLGPTILHCVATESLCYLARSGLHTIFPSLRQRSSPLNMAMQSLWITFFSSFFTETVLYPLETVLVRLYCQGMPMLVDNIQSGNDVIYVKEISQGFVNCVRGIWGGEGPLGFYKGYSALLLKYTIQGALLLAFWRLVSSLERWNNKK